MKNIFATIAIYLFFTPGCKKNDDKNNIVRQERLGPYNIYSGKNCNDKVPRLAPDYTYGNAGKRIVFSTLGEPSQFGLPEFYLKKNSSNEYIIYSIATLANDSTFWVWYDPEEINTNCTFSTSGCSSIRLEAFKNLNAVNGNKYIFKFDLDKTGGTLIETFKGRLLFTGEGMERSSGRCNRFANIFTSNNAPCKVIYEDGKPWDWCFDNLWFFQK